MTTEISAEQLKEALEPGLDLALIDVREIAEYNLAHIAGSCSLPRRLIEFRMLDLVPCLNTRIVVCDDDGGRASLAALTLTAMGYTEVAILRGGLNRWVTEGFPTEWGLNVPSKDFGEKLLHEQGIPEITPDELNSWFESGRRPLILDARTPEEHQRGCIPGSRSMPGAELGLRVWDMIEDPDAPIIVHCAGRTRSIVGAGTLQRMGLKQVYALKNGTMGWELAGHTLEVGSDRLALPSVSAGSLSRAESRALEIAHAEGVRFIDPQGLQSIRDRSKSENVYLFDVRTRQEYAAGHIPGFQWVPGGQAVQASDSYVAVKAGTLVFACDGSVRSSMTAAWFRQMGFANVYVLQGGVGAWTAAGLGLESGGEPRPPFGYESALRKVATISPRALQKRLKNAPASVVFVGTSEEFGQGHIAGSRWLPRSWLELRVGDVAPEGRSLVVTCPDGVASALAGSALLDLGYEDVGVLEGGVAAWRAAGLPLEADLAGVAKAPDDVLPVRRSFAEMLNYLRWEEELGEKFRVDAR